MKKIIHLSDLHIGFQVCGHLFARIVGNILFDKKPASDYVVLFTGDLVEDATYSANRLEARDHLDRLRSAGFDVLSVPGNHDYGTGTLGSKRYVTEYKEMFFGDASISYPKLDIIDGVAFLGLDSMAEELHWYDRLFAEGEIGDRQLSALDGLLSAPEVQACQKRVVYLHHHPFDPLPFHELKDAEALRQAVEGRIDALFYGHNHEGKTRNGHWGIPRCYDGASATGKEGVMCHRVIDLERDPRWDYDGHFE